MKTEKDKDLQYINCPKCGWHGAVINTKTGLITCQYCMYRSKKNDTLTIDKDYRLKDNQNENS